MHKKMLGLSSLLMAGMLTVSSVGTGALHVYAAEEPAVTDSADEEQIFDIINFVNANNGEGSWIVTKHKN